MNHCTGCKKRTVLLCILMICVQLIGMTGCASQDIVSGLHEPVIDNDLVSDVVYDCITFKVGESWVDLSKDDSPVYVYPDTRVVYSLLGYSYFSDWVKNEDNYFSYVLDYLRETDGFDKVTVLKRMDPYVTADGRNAYISRLRINHEFDGMDSYWDTDLLIIPENKFFVLFTVVYRPDETVPLDIREVVDTATFDFASTDEETSESESVNSDEASILGGLSLEEGLYNRVLEFTDSNNFVIYFNPDNRGVSYSSGTYRAYFGEEAIKKVEESGNDAFENSVARIFKNVNASDYNEYYDYFDGIGDIVFIIFETKSIVDDAGNELQTSEQTLYVGAYYNNDHTLILYDENEELYLWWIPREDIPYFSVEGMTFYDKDSNIVVDFYDSDNFYIYADPDNRVTNFAYGNYKVYVGEEAFELLCENPDFGNTPEETDRYINNSLYQKVYRFPHYNIRYFGEDYLIAIVFDTKGFVASDDSGIDFSSLYFGYQIEENDVLVLSDGVNDNPYFWEKEE